MPLHALDPLRLPVEVVTDEFRLVDASAVLPRREGARYPRRRPAQIDRIIVHQTQGGTLPPPEGLLRLAQFFIADDVDGKGSAGRGWPGMGYTFFVPFQPLLDEGGRAVVYRCQPDDVVSWHTAGQNAVGVAVALQGFFACRRAPKRGQPSPRQVAILRPLLDYLCILYGGLRGRMGRTAVYGHAAFGDPSCPGFFLDELIRAYRASTGETP